MARPSTTTTLTFGRRTIAIRVTPSGRHTVIVTSGSGRIVKKNLSRVSVNWLVGQVLKGVSFDALRQWIPIRPVLLPALASMRKLSGIDWMAVRMLGGSRPIILRAPGIDRGALIHIERHGTKQDTFNLRLVYPDREFRTEPVEITESESQSFIDTFRPL